MKLERVEWEGDYICIGLKGGADELRQVLEMFSEEYEEPVPREPMPATQVVTIDKAGAETVYVRGVSGEFETATKTKAEQLAEELGVDLSTVTGSGKNGRILLDDVRQAANKETENEDAPDGDIPSSDGNEPVGDSDDSVSDTAVTYTPADLVKLAGQLGSKNRGAEVKAVIAEVGGCAMLKDVPEDKRTALGDRFKEMIDG